jgi:cytochrome c553
MMSRFMTGILFAVLASSAAHAASTLQSGLDEVLRRKPDLDAGERKYSTACRGCHGAAGEGQLQGQAPRIAGQHFTVIVSELVGFRLGRRTDWRMQARASDHNLPGSQDMADVAAYAAQLSGGAIDHGSGKQVERGGQLYANRCSSCHGARAEGSERPVVPRLAGQNYDYLVRQLQYLIEGRRPAAGRDHLKPLQSMDTDQVMGLADYLSRLP